jgi:ankyrin repeat protein
MRGNTARVLALLDQDKHLLRCCTNFNGYTGLHYAAIKGHHQIINSTATYAAFPDVIKTRSNGGYTPLSLAYYHNRDHVIDAIEAACLSDKRTFLRACVLAR